MKFSIFNFWIEHSQNTPKDTANTQSQPATTRTQIMWQSIICSHNNRQSLVRKDESINYKPYRTSRKLWQLNKKISKLLITLQKRQGNAKQLRKLYKAHIYDVRWQWSNRKVTFTSHSHNIWQNSLPHHNDANEKVTVTGQALNIALNLLQHTERTSTLPKWRPATAKTLTPPLTNEAPYATTSHGFTIQEID